jgi:hypothetical protein
MALAENGNYRESRYFTRWAIDEVLEYQLPKILHEITK